MNRRNFLKGSAAAVAGGATLLGACRLPGASTAPAVAPVPASALRLTILHTNDMHSHLEPADSGRFAGYGGAPARATLVRQWREREKNLLLLDSGDVFQGTPYFNIYEGEPDILAMNMMGYVASTVGNHEFDAGIERMAAMFRLAQFPFLCANYDFTDTPVAGLTKESMVIERDGLRIGLFGLGIKLAGLVLPRWYGETKYLDPVANAQRVAKQLRHDEKCDFIICLSHINLEEKGGEEFTPGDRTLIREVPEIDLILGGHNHNLLPHPEVSWRGRDNTMGYVAQAGWAGTHVGCLQFDIYGRDQRELSYTRNLAVGGTSA